VTPSKGVAFSVKCDALARGRDWQSGWDRKSTRCPVARDQGSTCELVGWGF
jgi:hypothetical protein